ncbi:MAG: hypothetical protein JSR87_02445 [Proteobacteria bacterium]|nr:hypothetical protein [Pseudomonadota bacterium]MBS0573427.1 hypothetical protein [Pseudomonadota bacterium]
MSARTLRAIALALAGAAAAPVARALDAPALSAPEFEALTTGHTFFYTLDGRPFGAEQYLPGHRVIWAFTGADCEKGAWTAEGDSICFTYETRPGLHQCWRFRQTAQGLQGSFVGAAPGEPPLVARQSSPEPMACLGPDVGV